VAAGRSETEDVQGAHRRCACGFVDLLEQERTGTLSAAKLGV
jgi:hypothetical protein